MTKKREYKVSVNTINTQLDVNNSLIVSHLKTNPSITQKYRRPSDVKIKRIPAITPKERFSDHLRPMNTLELPPNNEKRLFTASIENSGVRPENISTNFSGTNCVYLNKISQPYDRSPFKFPCFQPAWINGNEYLMLAKSIPVPSQYKPHPKCLPGISLKSNVRNRTKFGKAESLRSAKGPRKEITHKFTERSIRIKSTVEDKKRTESSVINEN